MENLVEQEQVSRAERDEQGARDDYEIVMLDPGNVSFSRGSGGVFQGVIGQKSYKELVIFRTFPFLYASQYISVRDVEGLEIGIIENLDELDLESKREVEAELAYRYFLPQVLRVDSVKQKKDLWLWVLETSLGKTRIAMPNLHEYMQWPGGNRIILNDLNGRRCEIKDWRQLDHHSRKQLKDVV